MTLKNNNRSTIACMSAWNKAFACAGRFPQIYMLLVAPLALLGFAFLLFFPAMIAVGIGKLIHLLTFTPILDLLSYAGQISIWTGITVFCAVITRQILSVRFTPPEGINISSMTASRLHNLLEQVKTQVVTPKIDRIIITEQLSLDIAKTPKFALPLWSTNTLVVGLPLMQCLSPEYFKCALVRKLIQHSKRNHWLPKWLSQLRNFWIQYPKQFSPQKNKANIVPYIFFKIYAPLYKFLSIPLANYVELLSDQDTLAVINDEDLLQTIEKVIVTKIYLEKQYWPKINSMLSHNRHNFIEPYSRLEQVLQRGLTPQLSKRWLDTLYCIPSTQIQPVPDLRSRMNNIGRSSIRIPEKITESAASYFLDNAYSDIISEVNQMWLLRYNHLYNNTRMQIHQYAQQTTLPTPASRMNTELFN